MRPPLMLFCLVKDSRVSGSKLRVLIKLLETSSVIDQKVLCFSLFFVLIGAIAIQAPIKGQS